MKEVEGNEVTVQRGRAQGMLIVYGLVCCYLESHYPSGCFIENGLRGLW